MDPITQPDGSVVYEECPIVEKLSYTPYLVVPRLALQAMPREWRLRFAALMDEMEATGMETPEYNVFRAEDIKATRNYRTGAIWYSIKRTPDDPWANYKRGKVEELCPTFRRPK